MTVFQDAGAPAEQAGADRSRVDLDAAIEQITQSLNLAERHPLSPEQRAVLDCLLARSGGAIDGPWAGAIAAIWANPQASFLDLLTLAQLNPQQDLTGRQLLGVRLEGCDLSGANLQRVNLRGSQLCDADLSGADLAEARLAGADLSGALLSDVNLTKADLHKASLALANLSGANLSGANLSGANLSRVNFHRAIVTGAVLGNNEGLTAEDYQQLVANGAIGDLHETESGG
ncbi:pentapeptide repeat-containing protein [Limnothrix sp. FACHB-708]|uniref:pentapeptide repeat-containing protein n=1 Tax=unclassified Limnothrix TaxID=2632864 RepID=UPI003221B36A